MKVTRQVILAILFLILCGCTFFISKQAPPDPEASSPPPVTRTGKKWHIIEESPKLGDEHGRLPFQMEQSIEPEGAKPVTPVQTRTIKTPL